MRLFNDPPFNEWEIIKKGSGLIIDAAKRAPEIQDTQATLILSCLPKHRREDFPAMLRLIK